MPSELRIRILGSGLLPGRDPAPEGIPLLLIHVLGQATPGKLDLPPLLKVAVAPNGLVPATARRLEGSLGPREKGMADHGRTHQVSEGVAQTQAVELAL